MILYLHGFRSSPESFKAQHMQAVMTARGMRSLWRCPALPVSPAQSFDLAHQQALDLCLEHHAGMEKLTIVGSSLGGFYATCLAETLGCRAVLLNPAVHAPRDLATQVGKHENYHNGEPMDFLASYVDELEAMAITRITRPERYFLIAATGDEVLDWNEMREFFQGSRQTIIQGGDHGLTNVFADLIPDILSFAYPDIVNQPS